MSKDTKKPMTAQEQLEMDIMAEAELARLQRQYRLMDGDRQAFEEDTTAQLKKQGRVLRLLRQENAEINKNFEIAGSKGNRKRDAGYTLEIQKLLRENGKYKEAIRKQKNDLKEIEYQVKKVETDVHQFKKREDTSSGEMQKRILNGAKTLESLENKLDTCVKRYCTVLAENQRLREEIELFLKERNVYNQMYERQIKTLTLGKKLMIDLIEQATLAYDQREECGEKLQALRIRAHNDCLLHMADMRELIRQLDHGTSLQDFLSVKGQKRILKDLEKKEQQKKQRIKEALEQEVLHYKETLAKVQELAGEEDISKLSAQFIKQEEENFALFNYVNELNYELEALSDNIEKLHENIGKFVTDALHGYEQREISEKRAEQQKDTIDSLKNELIGVQEEEQKKKAILQQRENELRYMLKGVEVLFNMVRCDNTPILNLLRILENRVNDLVQAVNYKDKVILGDHKIEHCILEYRNNFPLTRPTPQTPCSKCAEEMLASLSISEPQKVKNRKEVSDVLDTPQIVGVMHNLASCELVNRLAYEKFVKPAIYIEEQK
ncbi:hypothetical protein MML48_8g00009415 [Holotrichia oblita]|uniref:Uncharacterized protein n=1 Tax=Holotrichia oblita TaxID=644536 RepID=A0ACB9SUX1_HOLOL|nr:hypothetical protein MML48_8g00009415 [Holotrichia oblita]